MGVHLRNHLFAPGLRSSTSPPSNSSTERLSGDTNPCVKALQSSYMGLYPPVSPCRMTGVTFHMGLYPQRLVELHKPAFKLVD